ncbi:bifunctional metallophosphatase/5'-nucleotidase [Dongia rigui]|uniref:Bifunctional UDP-sugar hydrolase/5'-nucleotidase n=1 Tax=Dongia rigui TaxID=940149 RepID=A0ABU5DTT0_9PROT|nr:bifunctional UDP-sugar hydrolase/5'-nucleotidase [Dongia rigui]MDY0870720.1 bifunctional UDP-sugar hydrolase/5'-nucleotidase [Dongia rigui]
MLKRLLCSAVFLFTVACAAPHGGPVTLRILAFNDFHGNIQAEKPSPGRLPVTVNGETEMAETGGAAYLATMIAQQQAGHPNNIIVSAGDLTGASPLVSALLKDEPTIDVMNRIGLGINVVGNHEFDYGAEELRRKKSGDGTFKGATFDYLAANVVAADTGKPLFPPFVVRSFGGIKVGFVGVVTAETPTIVAAAGINGLRFLNPTEALNRYAAELRRNGVEAIVAIMHEGASAPADIAQDGAACQDMVGALNDIVAAADPAIDLFITGHTHQAYACRLNGRLVSQTASYGRMLSVIDLTLQGGDVAAAAVRNVPVTHDLKPDAQIAAIVAAAESKTAPIRAQPVGTLAVPLSRKPNASGESALGDVIADAQLAAGRLLGAEIAFMNPGGIRQDLPSNPAAGLAVSLGDLFAVQPFGNNLVAMDLTGAQIKTLLEQQWLDQPADRKPRILQISAGFSYCYDDRRPEGDKILGDTLRLGPTKLMPERRYRVVVNSFLADGGDRFIALREGANRVQGDSDLNAFKDYIASQGDHLPADPQQRICSKG